MAAQVPNPNVSIDPFEGTAGGGTVTTYGCLPAGKGRLGLQMKFFPFASIGDTDTWTFTGATPVAAAWMAGATVGNVCNPQISLSATSDGQTQVVVTFNTAAQTVTGTLILFG